ncbi:MAG: histidine phosphatase family protein [Chloroflexi bacterium]|nr:histidine phosphatase family protein [Chloroflexota bacterium]
MPERTVYLVRHGQYDVASHPEDGLGGSLSELGRRQAELTAQRLSQLPVTSIWHSGLRRARETAEIIATRFPDVMVRSSDLLRECVPCIPVGYEAYFAHHPPQAIQQEAQQAEAALDEFFQPTTDPHRHEIIVCHGNIIRYFMLQALQAPIQLWANTDMFNCGIDEIQVQADGRVRLISHNDTGHLPYNLRIL